MAASASGASIVRATRKARWLPHTSAYRSGRSRRNNSVRNRFPALSAARATVGRGSQRGASSNCPPQGAPRAPRARIALLEDRSSYAAGPGAQAPALNRLRVGKSVLVGTPNVVPTIQAICPAVFLHPYRRFAPQYSYTHTGDLPRSILTPIHGDLPRSILTPIQAICPAVFLHPCGSRGLARGWWSVGAGRGAMAWSWEDT